MARVIRGVGVSAVRDLIYTRPKRMLDEYHENLFGEDGMGKHFSERFRDKATASINRMKRTRLARSVSATYRKLNNRSRLDVVAKLDEIGALQHATPRMQHFIMANQKLRGRWNRKLAAGYEHNYNKEPDQKNAMGHSHLAYRMVQDGLVVKEDENYTSYTYALNKEERSELDHIDKAAIRTTWQYVEEMLWSGLEDPSSQYNALL